MCEKRKQTRISMAFTFAFWNMFLWKIIECSACARVLSNPKRSRFAKRVSRRARRSIDGMKEDPSLQRSIPTQALHGRRPTNEALKMNNVQCLHRNAATRASIQEAEQCEPCAATQSSKAGNQNGRLKEKLDRSPSMRTSTPPTKPKHNDAIIIIIYRFIYSLIVDDQLVRCIALFRP